jgi:Flp pilus assembly protein TadD
MTGAPTEPATSPDAPAPLDEGRAAFAARDLVAAHAAFERAHRREPREPRAMSWYGVTLVIVERNSSLGVLLCDQAIRTAGPDPELLLNVARVHLALNQRERAVRPILRGLELFPDDARLRAARDAIGTRRAPPIPFLSRDNPLNRALGRLRHRWTHRRAPVYELSPVALGDPAAIVPEHR